MTVKQFLAGPIGTNCYLLINEKTKEAVIVDPASCPDYMMNYIKTEEIKLKAVLLTHAHFDHIMGIDDVLNKYGKMPVYVHEADKPMLEDPQQNMTMSCGFPYAYKGAQAVQDGQVLSLIGYEIKVLHTPGHTPGGCCYYIASEHVLISGDTLFQQSIGRGRTVLQEESEGRSETDGDRRNITDFYNRYRPYPLCERYPARA